MTIERRLRTTEPPSGSRASRKPVDLSAPAPGSYDVKITVEGNDVTKTVTMKARQVEMMSRVIALGDVVPYVAKTITDSLTSELRRMHRCGKLREEEQRIVDELAEDLRQE